MELVAAILDNVDISVPFIIIEKLLENRIYDN